MKKKIIPSVLAGAALLFGLGGGVNAAELGIEAGSVDMYNPATEQIEVKYDSIFSSSSATRWISERYVTLAANSLGEKYIIPYKDKLTVRNQAKSGKDSNECWAFVFTSALESYNYAKGNSSAGEVYSARHVNLSSGNVFKDRTLDKNAYDRDATEASGGSFLMATSYATAGKGPILESEMNSETELVSINYEDLFSNSGVMKHLEGTEAFSAIYKDIDSDGNITYYNSFDGSDFSDPLTATEVSNIRNRIKTQIKENGGVMAGVAQNTFDIDMNNVALYSGNTYVAANHAVFIVGWDDNYKADTWNNSGAYIALNSYGTERFDNGYCYISYDDFYVEQGLVGITEVSDKDYDMIYQYDELGTNSNFYIRSQEDSSKALTNITAVNIFEREDTEVSAILSEIGISSWNEQKATIYYSDTFDYNGNPTNFKLIDSGISLKNGYTTYKLNNNIVIDSDKYAVAVSFESALGAYIPVENPNLRDLLSLAEANKGESKIVYTASDGSFDKDGNYYFMDMELSTLGGTTYSVNAGIKAIVLEGEEIENPDDPGEPSGDTSVESTEYKVNNNVITRVPVNTTIDEFKENITVSSDYTIIDRNGNEVHTKLVRTGHKVKVGNDLYEISVISDISGSGGDKYSRALDLAKMQGHIVEYKGFTLTGIQLSAADINGDGKISAIDLARLLKLSVE